MGNRQASPFPTYDNACSYFNAEEIAHFHICFRSSCRQNDAIELKNLCAINVDKITSYSRHHMLPKLFIIIDTKKDSFLDFEEYLCALALFRFGTFEEKMRLLFIIYEPTPKSLNGTISKEILCNILKDSLSPTNLSEGTAEVSKYYEEWSDDLGELVEGMADMVLIQYASQDNRLNFQEFLAFAKVEGSIQGLVNSFQRMIEF